MTEKCNHYWVEDFNSGDIRVRIFKCFFCKETNVELGTKPVNYRDVPVTKYWAKRLKELLAS